MAAALLPNNEDQRLARLRALDVLDSAPEPVFDAFTRLAATLCATPIALVTLVDAQRQWFKSRVGLALAETPRDHAFCAHALCDDALLEVADARLDARFAHNPMVTGAPHFRFYAGAPIVLAPGVRVGTLCVIDHQPRVLDAQQREQLLAMADAIAQTLQMRQQALASATVSAQLVATESVLRRELALRQQVEAHAAELDRLLAERSEMLDVLAHEVRQPLNNASAALQSAAAALLGTGEHEASVRLQRAQAVMGQVLAGVDNSLAAAALLASAGPLAQADTDIDMLVSVVIADMPLGERARILVQRHTPTRTATMDVGLMRLALRNLLANALKYSPAGSPVQLIIADADEPLALVLDVVDRGPGFDPMVLSRLFERGAKGPGGGMGLGLYIARRVMELHGGRISLLLDHTDGAQQGSTLRLTIEQTGP
jgi:signal transduction histidine kinase